MNSGNARVLSTSKSTSVAAATDASGQQTNDNNSREQEEEEGSEMDTRRDKLNDRREEQRPALVSVTVLPPAGQMSSVASMATSSRPTLISRHLSVQVGPIGGVVVCEDEDDPIYDVPPSKSTDLLRDIQPTAKRDERNTSIDAYVHSSTPNLYLLAPIAAKRHKMNKQHHQPTKTLSQDIINNNNNNNKEVMIESTTTTEDILGCEQDEEQEQMVITSYKARVREEEEDSIYDTPSVRSLAIYD